MLPMQLDKHMTKECPENSHHVNLVEANGLAGIHQGRIAGKEVDPLIVDRGATIMVVKIDHIPSDAFTGKRVPVVPFNGAPPSTLRTAVVSIAVQGWHAEREEAVAETLC